MVPAVVVAVTLVAWARLPWAARKVVWAEDGALFLSELEKYGFWPTLFKPYAGYLQFWPRVLTEISAQSGDLGLYADRISLVACLAAAAIAGGVFFWSQRIVRSRWLRLLLALLPVVVSTAPIEVLGNVANLHWIVIWGAAWLLLFRPSTQRGAVALALLGASFAATEIQVVFLVPLILVGLKSRRSWVVRGGLLAGSAAQIATTITAPRPAVAGHHVGLSSMVLGYLINGPYALLVGDASTAGTGLASFGWVVAGLALCPFLLALAYVVMRGDRTTRYVAFVLFITSGVAWCAACYMNLTAEMGGFNYASFTRDQFVQVGFFRYGFTPGLFLLALPVLALSTRFSAPPADRGGLSGRTLRIQKVLASSAVIVSVPVLLMQLVYFTPVGTERTGQPLWSTGVDQARVRCATAGTTAVQIPIAPSGWAASLPCRSVRP